MTKEPECGCACSGEVTEAQLLERLNDLLDDYKDKPGGLIPLLQLTQSMFGYLPQEALKKISVSLNKPYSEISGVVSFYSFFSTVPKGRNVVRVCLGTACYVRGGKDVLAAFRKELGIDVGQTTANRDFSLEVGRCFGACGLAPAVMINDQVHQRVKPAKIKELLAPYREEK
jgi:NADH:ubiquinone oxidoreductase subunit E